MTLTCPERITCEQDARDFFRYLYVVESVCFHPDDNFSGYVNIATGEPSFTPEQVVKYNMLMEQAFDVCCPYTVGMEVGREEGFIPPEDSED